MSSSLEEAALDATGRRLPSPARYFPVRPRPYRMEAGLMPFGRDFGNGEADRSFFQVDDQLERYRRIRRELGDAQYTVLAANREQVACNDAVLSWMTATLRREHPNLYTEAAPSHAGVAHAVQEDFVVLRRDREGRSEAIAVFVSFPSGWRPERIGGADFKRIHAPVPAFAEVDAAVASMVEAMVERGPYVRFVWAISADDHLDHHPERGHRLTWAEASTGWLRVERQVTVPFPALGASLFLIRTYLYAFDSFDERQRRTLAAAIERMPADVARYKGVSDEVRSRALRLLS